jgi:hypothetical protein
MNIRQYLCTAAVAMVPLCSMTLALAPAQAQQYSRDSAASPVIRGFNVNEVRRIAPGVELNFDLYGTAGGNATLRIDGATRNVHLTETEPGQYQGTYTIGTRDRIGPSSAVSANLRVGNRVASDVLSESLLRDGARQAPKQRGQLAVVPRVERFQVQGSDDLGAGNELDFTVRGTPGARVSLSITGARGVFFLPEVRPGEYSGTYTIRQADRIAPNAAVTATISANGRQTTSTLGQPLLAGGPGTAAPRVARYCTNCATVAEINLVEVTGSGSYLGNGAVGSSSGRSTRSSSHYEVVVRYANGGNQTIVYENDPGYRVGERVRVNDGALVRDQ